MQINRPICEAISGTTKNRILSLIPTSPHGCIFQGGTTKSYRLEEVPKDQEELQDGEILVPVAHFSKEVFSTFGAPFLILLIQGDNVGSVKNKIQEKLGVRLISIYCNT